MGATHSIFFGVFLQPFKRPFDGEGVIHLYFWRRFLYHWVLFVDSNLVFQELLHKRLLPLNSPWHSPFSSF